MQTPEEDTGQAGYIYTTQVAYRPTLVVRGPTTERPMMPKAPGHLRDPHVQIPARSLIARRTLQSCDLGFATGYIDDAGDQRLMVAFSRGLLEDGVKE